MEGRKKKYERTGRRQREKLTRTKRMGKKMIKIKSRERRSLKKKYVQEKKKWNKQRKREV